MIGRASGVVAVLSLCALLVGCSRAGPTPPSGKRYNVSGRRVRDRSTRWGFAAGQPNEPLGNRDTAFGTRRDRRADTVPTQR
jgi:hypothetical protein